MTSPKKTLMQQLAIVTPALALLALTPAAYSAETFTEALTDGKTTGSVYYRNEIVNENKAINVGRAHTVQVRLGYETGQIYGFGAKVEAEHVTALGPKDYNSLANRKTQYSVVADPEFTEFDQAYLSYSGIEKTNIKVGRQRLALDNHRFIGDVPWRQNYQTLDAVSVVNESLPQTKVTLAYVGNVNRVTSDNAIAQVGPAAGNLKMNSPLLNVNYKGFGFGEIVGYGYLLDINKPVAASNFNSNKTYGLRLKGKEPLGDNTLLYTAEYATQSNYANNPATYNVKYHLLEGVVDFKIADFKLAREVLGGNGQNSFSTPLSTLHAFNGWVDMFLVQTPVNGLVDAYASAGTALDGYKFVVIYHDFRADLGGAKYGTELNAQVTKTFDKKYVAGIKYGRFYTSKVGTSTSNVLGQVDTDKFWFWLSASL